MNNKKIELEIKENNIIQKLISIINNSNITHEELINIISKFLFSIGSSIASLSTDDNITNELILTRYAKNPSFEYALMAQAIHMKETWVKSAQQYNKKE